MLSSTDLNALQALADSATPGPWYVRFLDDDHAMSAIGIADTPDSGEHEAMAAFDYPGPELLAATLVQAPPYVVSKDGKWQDNANLIVAMRNVFPELLRLARLGLQVEREA